MTTYRGFGEHQKIKEKHKHNQTNNIYEGAQKMKSPQIAGNIKSTYFSQSTINNKRF